MAKKRMSAFKFRLIMGIVIVVCAVLLIAVNVAAYLFTPFLDDRLGRGDRHAVIPEGRDGWDTDYYEDLYDSTDESKEAAYKLALDVQREGTILLKNNGVLPLAKGSTVTPFGFRYKSPVVGQTGPSGSAKWNIDPVTPEEGLSGTFTINTAAYDNMEGNPTSLKEASGTLSAGTGADLMGHSSKLYEYDAETYTDVEASGTALVFIGREGAEGSDKKFDAYSDGTPHYFALTQNEKDMVRIAKEKCDNVVVILETASAMQMPELMSGELEVDAIVQFGHAGERGYSVLGDVLSGAVNPSGRTVDIWASDFTKDPTYMNFGEFKYTNPVNTGYAVAGQYYIEYEEGVYMGYRYYETAHDIGATGFTYGTLDGKGAIEEAGAVLYPFGYGLSYTTFEQTITRFDTSGGNISVSVEVKNTGDKDGKEVVQIYYDPPYTDLDKTMKIEKPTATLVAFAKTGVIEAGKSETVTITFRQEDMASYCYTKENPDDTVGCYMLEEGDYEISVGKNSHEAFDSETWTNNSTIWYDNTNPRQSEIDAQSALDAEGNSLDRPANGDENYTAATNLFQDSSDYMQRDATIFSRANWDATFPKLKTEGATIGSGSFWNNSCRGGDELSEESAKYFEDPIHDFDVETDKRFGNVEESIAYHAEEPVYGKDNGLTVSDLRGKDYYDEAWDEWLDQVDFDDPDVVQQILDLSALANYATTSVDSLGLPRTVHSDGANGLKVFKTDAGMEMSATYSMTPVWASTWNTELLNRVGDALGREALENNISGWYSPAINLHRSPFSGRNFEYYSEDPLLTGKIAAAVVSGASEAGMYCYIKHFALNDEETRRNEFLATWATEQAMRELYFKAFEIPVKEAKMTINYTADENGTMAQKTMRAATAIMASQNCIGQYYCHADYRLLTGMLRNEWGFLGTVTSDMYTMPNDSMFDMAYRSGLDTFLPIDRGKLADSESASAHWMFRRILHDVGYTVANSNAMQGVPPGTIFYYDISPWVLFLQLPLNLVFGLLIAGAIAWIVVRTIQDKKLASGQGGVHNE